MLVVSIGCPAGVGPEVSVAAAARLRRAPCVLVGDEGVILRAADLVGVPRVRFAPFDGKLRSGTIGVCAVGPVLSAGDCRPGRPSPRAGAAELAWIDAAYDLARTRGAPLVTAPVSKAAIARSGAPGAEHFVGHTEWLGARDRARRTVMCFASPGLVTSLVTTHLPVSEVAKRLSPERVADASVELARLLRALGKARPTIAVCSLNPHAGESELFGREEARAIAPGIERARRALGSSARLVGPVGAETAYRKAAAGEFEGVVAMYHDQATIPMKLVAFGKAVNVTMGLSIVRTSVDHGTAYDIAWRGLADASGMLAAFDIARRLERARARGSGKRKPARAVARRTGKK